MTELIKTLGVGGGMRARECRTSFYIYQVSTTT